MRNFKLVYKSDNGYTGVLIPGKKLSIYDQEGKEVLHTFSPCAKTYNELKFHVDHIESFLNILFDHETGAADD